MTDAKTVSITRRIALALLGGAATLAGTSVAGDARPTGNHELVEVDEHTGGDFGHVVDDVMNSTVTIRVFDERDREFSQGSGWVYDVEGSTASIVTNWHVVFGSRGADVRFGGGDWRSATRLLGSDRYSDLAVILVDDPPEYAEPMTIADEEPSQGQPIAAIGVPIGLKRTMTTGIVSAVDRSTTVSFEHFMYNVPSTIQVDAATNPGNSGGPVVNADGEVVGVSFAGTAPTIAEDINFSISSTMVRRIVPELLDNGSFDHPYVGLHGITLSPMLSRLNDVDETTEGVYVDMVVDGFPADEYLQGTASSDRVTGLPIGGDVVVGVDETGVGSTDALRNYLFKETRPGDDVAFSVRRDGEEEKVDVTLEERPTELERIDVREPTM